MTMTMTPKEFAEYIGVTRRTVYRWIRAGRLPGAEAKKIGGRWRIIKRSDAPDAPDDHDDHRQH